MADQTDPVLPQSQLSWAVALLGAIVATGVACIIFFGSLIDWWEGLVTPAHTLWGVVAMALSFLAPLYLVTLFGGRARFAILSAGQRWSLAVAIPIVFVAAVVGLQLVGHYVGYPVVIPYNDEK